MSTNLSPRDEAASVFGRALPLIELTLRREFRLPKQHAREVEQDVSLWFSRFASRPGSSRPGLMRTQLFCATCEAARQYWHWRLAGAPVNDERIRRALAREPEEMAKELEEKLRAREKREKPQEPGKESDS